MGDYSSTFTITNHLQNPLKLTEEYISDGYWIAPRWPYRAVPGGGFQTDGIQLKDNAGPTGTDGTVKYQVTVNGVVQTITIHVACPMGFNDNVADISVTNDSIRVAVSDFSTSGHPTTANFIVG